MINQRFIYTGSCHCGGVKWRYEDKIERATACNCTVCRRYGTIWAYGILNENIFVDGDTTAYTRGERSLGFHFCPICGCIAFWLEKSDKLEDKLRSAVNLRISANPEDIRDVPIRHFDGLNKFTGLEDDGCRVKNLWF